MNNFSKKRKTVQFQSNSERNINHSNKREKITHNASTAIPLIQISRNDNNNLTTSPNNINNLSDNMGYRLSTPDEEVYICMVQENEID